MVKANLKKEAFKLRVEQRKSYTEISKLLDVSKSTLSIWLREFPLSPAEYKAKRLVTTIATKNKRLGKPSPLYGLAQGRVLTSQQKGRIAEAAVILRILLNGFNPYKSQFDGDRIDLLVEVPESHRLLKIQVKLASHRNPFGRPAVSLQCTEGHNKQRRFQIGEFDYIIGYDLVSDVAYVWSWKEAVEHKTSITVTKSCAEAWNKLRK